MKKMIAMLSALLMTTAAMNAQSYDCAPCPTSCDAPCDPCGYNYSGSYPYGAPIASTDTGMNTASMLVGVVIIAGITGGIIYAATNGGSSH